MALNWQLAVSFSTLLIDLSNEGFNEGWANLALLLSQMFVYCRVQICPILFAHKFAKKYLIFHKMMCFSVCSWGAGLKLNCVLVHIAVQTQ